MKRVSILLIGSFIAYMAYGKRMHSPVESHDQSEDLNQLIGISEAFWRMRNRLDRVAEVQRNTLVYGPTGSGKELVAHALHELSARSDRPFVPVHCGSLPDSLVESELFGHSKGAFTGAVNSRPGLIQAAHGGTLFLDEINSLSLSAQTKLLRFLECGEYRAVGSDVCRVSDSWVIAASNEDLRECVSERRFREDLLFRLDIVRVEIPSLETRRDDVVFLAEHFLEAERNGALRFTEDAKKAMLHHNWPGNIRELKHRVEVAAAMAEGGQIDAKALELETNGHVEPPVSTQRGNLEQNLWSLIEHEGFTLGEAVGLCEKILVRSALEFEENNRAAAARRLGIHVRTIFKKLAP